MSDPKPTIAEVYRVLLKVDERTERLEQHVFTGNGQPSLMGRVATLEAEGKIVHRFVSAIVGAGIGFLLGPKP